MFFAVKENVTHSTSTNKLTLDNSRYYTLSNEPIQVNNTSWIANISDIPTKPKPLYSPYSPPETEPNSISLSPLRGEIAYAIFFSAAGHYQ